MSTEYFNMLSSSRYNVAIVFPNQYVSVIKTFASSLASSFFHFINSEDFITKTPRVFSAIATILILSAMLSQVSYAQVTKNSATFINFGIANMSAAQKQSYQNAVHAFEQSNPNVKVRFVTIDGSTYSEIYQNLITLKQPLDVLSWFGGHRLTQIVKADLVAAIPNNLNYKLTQVFTPASIERLQIDNQVYGVPVSYYPWGFYYNKQLFERLDLTPPKTWQQFLAVLAKLKRNQIPPIAMGLKTPWPASAWFDYLLLRNYSYHFYQKVMQGEVSYHSPKLQAVFTQWQQLITQKYYNVNFEFYGDNLLPHIIREYAGVYLMGSFALHRVPNNTRENIGYFSFPQIQQNITPSEIAPTSVIAVTKRSKYKNIGFQFLDFMSTPEIQRQLNQELTTLPPIKDSAFSDNELLMMGQLSLQNAEHYSQYFDRETPRGFAQKGNDAFAKFIVDGDLKTLTNSLEKARKTHYR